VKSECGAVLHVKHNQSGSMAKLPLQIAADRLASFEIESNEFQNQAKLSGEFVDNIQSSIHLANLPWGDGILRTVAPADPAPLTTSAVSSAAAASPEASRTSATSASSEGDGAPDLDELVEAPTM